MLSADLYVVASRAEPSVLFSRAPRPQNKERGGRVLTHFGPLEVGRKKDDGGKNKVTDYGNAHRVIGE